jgi:hypothetical protein
MRCEELAGLLPDYFEHNLPAASRATVEAHLRECSECFENVRLWRQLGRLPDDSPSPWMRTRFDAMLSAYEDGRRERKTSWTLAPAFRRSLAYAAALLILGVGFLAGRYVQPDREESEVATLRSELSSTNNRIATLNQLVVVSMLQQQRSASERLQGVNYSLQVRHANPEIVAALLQSLRSDSSVDVRLAALDSLRRYSDDRQVRRGLLDSLQPKQSPMVQIALIDALVEIQDADAVPQIKQLQQAPDLNPVVRDRARWGLAQLTRG